MVASLARIIDDANYAQELAISGKLNVKRFSLSDWRTAYDNYFNELFEMEM